MKNLHAIVFALSNIFFMNMQSMEYIKSFFSKYFVSGQEPEKIASTPIRNYNLSPNLAQFCAQAEMYFEGLDLKTAEQLLNQDAKKRCCDTSKIHHFTDPIYPSSLMVKIAFTNKSSNGLTPMQEQQAWECVPHWMPISFLNKRNSKNLYIFHVDKIAPKTIPIIVQLVRNSTYNKDPYASLEELKQNFKADMKNEIDAIAKG